MLPLLYHLHHSAYPEDLDFWLSLARKSGSPVLELGCGTGRLTLPLARAGYQVFGIDYDRTMLSFLKNSINVEEADRISIFQADMAEFRLAKLFQLIILPCNTLSSLDGNGRRAVFARVADHLHPDGMFVTSLPNPLLLAEMPEYGPEEAEDEFTHPQSGDLVRVSSSWRREKQVFILIWHYDLLQPDGKIERFSIETRHTLQPLEAYIREMELAGLSLLGSWGDYDRSEYHEDSELLILTASLGSR